MSILPAYLLLRQHEPTITPPLTVTHHELPVEQLAWENFERLCLRLVQTQYPIEACEQYGLPGQNQ